MARIIPSSAVYKIMDFVTEFSEGAANPHIGGDIGNGARYFEGTSSHVWLGSRGGRSLFSAYLIGFAWGWAGKSGREIPDDMRELMREVRCSYARRYESQAAETELDGRVTAEYRWERRNVLRVTNEGGVTFNVVLSKDNEGGRLAPSLWVVRVYDDRHDFTDFGQFTGGSAYMTTLLGLDDYGAGLGSEGWCLDGRVTDWRLSGSNALEIRGWLAGHARAAGLAV